MTCTNSVQYHMLVSYIMNFFLFQFTSIPYTSYSWRNFIFQHNKILLITIVQIHDKGTLTYTAIPNYCTNVRWEFVIILMFVKYYTNQMLILYQVQVYFVYATLQLITFLVLQRHYFYIAEFIVIGYHKICFVNEHTINGQYIHARKHYWFYSCRNVINNLKSFNVHAFNKVLKLE